MQNSFLSKLDYPNVTMLSCEYDENTDGGISMVTLSWILNGSAQVDNYTLTLSPHPPSLNPPLIITNTTTVTFTLLSDVTYTVQITAATNCVRSTSINYTISGMHIMKILDRAKVIFLSVVSHYLR